MTDSWDLKLDRAQDHLAEFKVAIRPYSERHAYPTRKGIETYKQVRQTVRRLVVPPIDEPMLPVVAGDFLFNVRSAYDHMAVALIHPSRLSRRVLRNTQFPIFTCDIRDRNEVTGKPFHRRQVETWERYTQGFTEDALAIVDRKQPYRFFDQGLDPEDSTMAILSLLQNADKHRQLVLLTEVILDPAMRFTHPDGTVTEGSVDKLPEGSLLRDGTVVDLAPIADPLDQVKVEVVATPRVVVGENVDGAHRECPKVFDRILYEARQVGAVVTDFIAHRP